MLPTVEKDDVYMDNYSDAYFDLYVLMTTANFPDIMCVPAACAPSCAEGGGRCRRRPAPDCSPSALARRPHRMPAYAQNEWYCLIFVVFLLLTMYIFLSILLAVVYDGYRGHLKVRREACGVRVAPTEPCAEPASNAV